MVITYYLNYIFYFVIIELLQSFVLLPTSNFVKFILEINRLVD